MQLNLIIMKNQEPVYGGCCVILGAQRTWNDAKWVVCGELVFQVLFRVAERMEDLRAVILQVDLVECRVGARYDPLHFQEACIVG